MAVNTSESVHSCWWLLHEPVLEACFMKHVVCASSHPTNEASPYHLSNSTTETRSSSGVGCLRRCVVFLSHFIPQEGSSLEIGCYVVFSLAFGMILHKQELLNRRGGSRVLVSIAFPYLAITKLL